MTSPSATNTALAEPELKTCPFCGGKPKGAYDDNTGSWEIFCTGCGCTMMAITEADCASWWNGRALQSKDDSAALEIAELKLQVKQGWKQLEPAYELLAEDHRKLLGEVAALKGEIARLREALVPFALMADKHPASWLNTRWMRPLLRPNVGDLRKARAALLTDGGTDGAA